MRKLIYFFAIVFFCISLVSAVEIFQPEEFDFLHNNIRGLQGGSPVEFYHLNLSQYNTLAPGGGNPVGSNGEIQFNDAGSFGADSNLFWDDVNKRLGIGTVSPTEKLDIRNGAIRVGYEADTFDQLIEFYRNNIKIGVIDNDGSDIRLRAQNGNDIKMGDSSGTKIILKDGGKVGIGTISPSEHLEVSGTGERNIRVTSIDDNIPGIQMVRVGSDSWRLHASNNDRLYLSNSANNGSSWSKYLYFGGTQANPYFRTNLGTGNLELGGGDNISFTTWTGSAWDENMKIDSNGNVGMGTTTPTPGFRLDVNGNLYVQGNLNVTGCITYNGGVLGACI